jgi:hypothetical protein
MWPGVTSHEATLSPSERENWLPLMPLANPRGKTRLNGLKNTDTPSKDGGSAVDVALDANVAEADVAEAGIWVEVSGAGIIVFVGTGAVLVEGTTVTDRSHAKDTTMNMERNKKIFFTVVLCMVEFPFMFNHIHQECKTPPSLGESLLSEWTGP